MLALAVSAYSTYWQRQQARAQTWPRLEFQLSDDPNFQVLVENVGVGPAEIRAVDVSVDGTPAKNWKDVLGRLGRRQRPGIVWTSYLRNRVLGGGSRTKTLDLRDVAESPQVHELFDRVRVSICYCSVLDECWRLRVDEAQVNEPVRTCAQEPNAFLD